MSKRIIALLSGVLAAALMVAGCGGGGEDTSSSLSKSQFIKEADKVCEKGDESLQKEATEFAEENDIDPEKASKADQEEVVTQVVGPALRKEAEGIGDLGTPAGDEGEVEKILDSLETGAGELEDEPKAALEGDNPLEEASKLARGYGFKQCGSQE